MNQNHSRAQWINCRVLFSAVMDQRQVDGVEISGCMAVFDRSKDLGEQAGAAVADWVSRQERIKGHRYQDAEISYIGVQTLDGRHLDATKLGWNVLDERQPLSATDGRSELEGALIQAIEGSGYSVPGVTDTRAAEDGSPAWVCNARAALAQSAATRYNDSRGAASSAGAKYVVMDEHTLGYRIPKTPTIIGVLAGSVLRGGRNPLDGTAVISPGLTRLRQATEIDFQFFGVQLPSDYVWEDGDCGVGHRGDVSASG